LYAFIISPMHATWPTYTIHLGLILLNLFGEVYKLWNSFTMHFPRLPGISSLLRLDILLSTLFSYTFHMCSSRSLRD
jgi:hypothetical protein